MFDVDGGTAEENVPFSKVGAISRQRWFEIGKMGGLGSWMGAQNMYCPFVR